MRQKNVIGVWYEEDNPKNWVEYTIGGTELIHKDGYDSKFRYKIVNTNPLCGEEVFENEATKTMYLIETDKDNIDGCYSFKIFENDDNKTEMALWALDMGANGISNYLKK